MDYIAVRLTVLPLQPGSDIMVSLLADIGYESFVLTDTGVDAFIPVDQFDEEGLKSVVTQDFFEVHYQKERIPHKNWNAVWEEAYEPVKITENCWVRAPFHQVMPSIPYDLVIQPQMSFGTGHHPTTELMLKETLTLDMEGKSVLDMGSGTGVLSVLADKMGAKSVLAIEIDGFAADNCQENVERNNCIHVDVENGDSSLINGRTFDVIFANINLNVLLSDIHLYVEALSPSGHLLLSGFYDNDQTQLIEPLSRLGLVHFSAKHIDHWTVLHFQKTK